MEKLHPGARWLFRLRAYFSLIFFGIFFGFFLAPLAGFFLLIGESNVVFTFLAGLVLALVFAIVVGEVYARLAYNNWQYEIGVDNIRLERGIIWKKYSNVPYERIQNVDIHRGIIARMLGFSSLMIQTAGYSAVSHGGHSEGYLPAIDSSHAEQIREYVLKRISGKHQGL